jgi:hypothetical protein
MPIVCLLVCHGACAIDISFSASNGGGTVGIVDSYDVDDSVGVSDRSSASFGDGVSMTDVNSLSGSGDAKVDQVFYGSGFGADYVAEYALRTFDASSIEAGGSASLAPDSCQVSKSASTTDGILTFARLRGRQNGDFAAVGSLLLFGDLTAAQNLATGQSVAVSQNTLADGLLAWSYAWAVDDDGSLAWTSSLMSNGTMSAGQTAESGNSARSSQMSEINASNGRAGSGAWDGDGNFAWTYAEMEDGEGDGVLVTEQTAAADGSAEASQVTDMEADRGGAGSMAFDEDGNLALTEAIMVNGTLWTDQGAWAGDDWWFDEGVEAFQQTEITADRGAAESVGFDAEGNEAWTRADMENGTLETDQGAWAGEDGWEEGALAGQYTEIVAESGSTGSFAEDDEGNEAETMAEMENGTLLTNQIAFAGDDWWVDDEGAVTYQDTFIKADRGNASSKAWDDDGNVANTSAVMVNGTLETHQDAWAGYDWWFEYEGAEAYQDTFIEADRGNVSSAARDKDGNVANTSAVMVNGTLETDQGAWAGEDWGEGYGGAEAGQWTEIIAENGSAVSIAEDSDGSYVWIGAVVENGSLETEQWAEASNSANGSQETSIDGDFAYAFCEANNTGKGYFAYVDNWVNGSAYLEFEGNAYVNDSEARADQRSYAEGNRIWPWANSTNYHDEEDTTGIHYFESRAWTNGTGEYADVELII